MEKTRVPKGRKYCYIDARLFIRECIETGSLDDDARFEMGNYFHSSHKLSDMALKLEKVLKGADVIEMPSEKEIEEAMKTSVTESILCVAPYESFTPKATDLMEGAWMKGAEWLKSKIMK